MLKRLRASMGKRSTSRDAQPRPSSRPLVRPYFADILSSSQEWQIMYETGANSEPNARSLHGDGDSVCLVDHKNKRLYRAPWGGLLAHVLALRNDTSASEEVATELERLAKECTTAIADTGAVPLLVAVLRDGDRGSDSGAREWALRALDSLATGSEECTTAIVDAGAVPLLAAVLRETGDNDKKGWAASVLERLATGSKEHATAIVDAGAVPLLVAVLRETGDNDAKGWAASALESLATGSEECAMAIADAGAVPLLVAMLRDGDNDAKGWASSALKRLATGPGSEKRKTAIADAGAVPLLVEVLRDGDLDNMSQAAIVLGSLAVGSEKRRTAIADAGAVPLLMEVLRDGDLDNMSWAAAALGFLAGSEVCASAIADAGAVPLLVTMLRDGDSRAKHRAMGALGNIGHGFKGCVSMIVNAGAVPLLVAMLRDGSDGAKPMAAIALGRLASGSEERVKTAIADAGAVPLLLAMLQDPDGDSFARKRALLTLRSLGSGSRSELMSEACRTAIADAGAVPLLVKVLRDGDGEAKQSAATLIGCLAGGSEERASAIVEAEAVPLLVEVLRDGDSWAKVQGMLALHCLATGSEERTSAIMEAGAVQLLVKVLRDGDNDVKKQAATLLRHLATGSEVSASAIADAGAVPLLVAMLRDGKTTRARAAMALATVASGSEEHVTAIADAGAVPLLVSILVAGLRDFEHVDSRKWALIALDRLASRYAECASAIVDAGAVPLLVVMLRDGDGDTRQREATSLGHVVAGSQEHKTAIAVLKSCLAGADADPAAEAGSKLLATLMNIVQAGPPADSGNSSGDRGGGSLDGLVAGDVPKLKKSDWNGDDLLPPQARNLSRGARAGGPPPPPPPRNQSTGAKADFPPAWAISKGVAPLPLRAGTTLVKVFKNPSAGYGMSVANLDGQVGVFIVMLKEFGAAEMTGRLSIGQRIFAVNGVDMECATTQQAIHVLRNSKVAVLQVPNQAPDQRYARLDRTPLPASAQYASLCHAKPNQAPMQQYAQLDRVPPPVPVYARPNQAPMQQYAQLDRVPPPVPVYARPNQAPEQQYATAGKRRAPPPPPPPPPQHTVPNQAPVQHARLSKMPPLVPMQHARPNQALEQQHATAGKHREPQPPCLPSGADGAATTTTMEQMLAPPPSFKAKGTCAYVGPLGSCDVNFSTGVDEAYCRLHLCPVEGCGRDKRSNDVDCGTHAKSVYRSMYKQTAAHAPARPRDVDVALATRADGVLPGGWDVFLSHTQRNGEAKAAAIDLYYTLERHGFKVWLDVKMPDRSEAAMEIGVRNSKCVVAIITKGPSPDDDYFSRPFCLQELRWAIDSQVKIQPVINIEDKKRIGEFVAGAPADLKHLGSTDFVELYRGDADFWEVSIKKVIVAAGLT